MKILHLADLHLGKRVNDFSMLEEQKYVLNQLCECIKKNEIDYILISGDVFDKTIPTIEAIELFSDFLNFIYENNKKIFIVPGNHDSEYRLSSYSALLEKTNVYIAKPFEKEIEKIKINDSVNFYLLPYLHISQIKRIFPDKNINTLNEAFKVLIDNTSINEKETNIILAHQFVVGGDLILSDSEQKSVGGVDEIHYSVFEKFDYCALGHLHCPQKVGMDKIRYGGSILKYSLSEINQKKSFCIIEIDDDKKIKFKFEPISFIHEMKQYRGKIDEFLSENFYSNIDTEDYIHFILEDEEVIDAKKKLSLIYPNIMLIEFDNSFTRSLNAEFKAVISQDKTIVEHFMDFYKIQTETELNKSDIELIKEISVELGGQECAQ